MRLIEKQINFIRQLMAQLAGGRAQAHVFGSRLDGTEKGESLDLLLELSDSVESPIMLVACMSAKVPRKMHECKVGIFIRTLIPKSYRSMTSGTGKDSFYDNR